MDHRATASADGGPEAAADPRRRLPRVALAVPALGFGAAAIGNLFTAVTDEAAGAAVEEAYRLGIRLFDTAPHYGYGLSEQRLGHALASLHADDAVISTKVGRLIVPGAPGEPSDDGFAVSGRRAVFDYSRGGIMRSFESSLRRLRRGSIDILLLHDIGRETHGERHEKMLKLALDEALPAMAQLKASGACRAIGIGVNEQQACLDVMTRFDLDCILLAGRYTLLEQRAAAVVLAEAARRGVGILAGGPFNSGLLASSEGPGRTYNYRPADEATLQRAREIYAICAAEGVDVGAAALQFPLAHPAVVSVVAGMRSPAEVSSAVARTRAPIPGSVWRRLREAGLLTLGAPTP
ncbi:MAG: aldo/keto reductase [Gammaproteobacteria bacterium]|nr:aldo/keto reductase [Gammaproteobacteria bacterium]